MYVLHISWLLSTSASKVSHLSHNHLHVGDMTTARADKQCCVICAVCLANMFMPSSFY